MMRDFQRSKVYAAERVWEIDVLSQIPEMREALSMEKIFVLASRMIINREIRLSDGRGTGRATCTKLGNWGVRLNFPRASRDIQTVCHECAHGISSHGVGHGPEYCRNMIILVRDYISPLAASRLVYWYGQGRVVVSEAQEQHYMAKRTKQLRGLDARY